MRLDKELVREILLTIEADTSDPFGWKDLSALSWDREQVVYKCVLGEMISRYMVLVQTEQKILMMRPYQIYAVRNIVRCIDQNCGNGYVWHTTGSGKTLTSFKASTLLKGDESIQKVLFVVDRKDLDTQTRDEFNRFQPDCVEENITTSALVERMLSEDYADKVIVTTIQKLGIALDAANRINYAERLKKLSSKRIVFVFDECHRSQFGDTHEAIKQFFPLAQMFGFTGTPIFEENSTAERRVGEQKYKLTTKHLFPHELHRYTISNAIDDRNVLGFQVEYYKPDGTHAVTAGETLKKQKVVEEILAKHDKATLDRRFNALLATNSIPDAIEYVQCFREIQGNKAAADPMFVPLNIACIFSPPPSPAKDNKFSGEDLAEDLPQEQEDNQHEPDKKREALTGILTEYNTHFGTNHRLDDFYAYYRDVQKRIKNQKLSSTDLPRAQKIDVCIVVDMLLTGFDSQYLKVLYVDKRLKHHGLIQAFSRTNRTLNDTKPWGAIVDFRGQEEQVNQAMVMFSGEPLAPAQTIWLVDPSPVVMAKLKQAVTELTSFMESQGLTAKPEDVANLKGDATRAAFVERFAEVQKFSNQLEQYTDLTPEQEAEREQVMPVNDLQGFRTQYLETVRRLREDTPPDGPGPADDLDFNLVLFSSAKIDYDFIMALVAKGGKPDQIRASREQAKQLLAADSKFDDPEEIGAYKEHSANRNEATTRFHLIDQLLFDCLSWDKDDVTMEESHDGAYADYTFSCPRRLLIVEAKREGINFEIPVGQTRLDMGIPAIKKASSDAAAALEQVSTYCQKRGVPFAAVSNGHQLIAFIGSRSDAIPPMEGRALVFGSVAEMRDNFRALWEAMSRPGVQRAKLSSILSEGAPQLPQKLSAQTRPYPGVAERNVVQNELQILSDLVLEEIVPSPELEETFLRRCYTQSGPLSQFSMASKQILESDMLRCFSRIKLLP